MRKILLIGAGKSSSSLIKYFAENAVSQNWEVIVADVNVTHIREKYGSNDRIKSIVFDAFDQEQREKEIQDSDIVISMLPYIHHMIVAKDCLKFGKNLVTASYISDEMKKTDEEVKNKGILFLNEIGLDPGIDHMSAMKLINQVKDTGAEIIAFETFTGGLISPESEGDNPWRYKFTWNPRAVVIAGQGTPARFLQKGRYKYIPYHKLFRRTEVINIEGYGNFTGYPNRDSIKYISLYGLEGIQTFFRGTLRRPGFCRAWDLFVQLGVTDDTFVIANSENLTHRSFFNSFLAYNPIDSVELKLQHYLHIDQDSDLMEKLEWLGIFENKKVGIKNATPAKILQHILEQKWTLSPEDKDMIVMFNKLDYMYEGKHKQIQSYMVVEGEDQVYTSMAKTVGLPLAIATKLILNGEIKLKGVHIPLDKEVYEPVMKELEIYGITFKDKTVDILKEPYGI